MKKKKFGDWEVKVKKKKKEEVSSKKRFLLDFNVF